MEILPVQNNHPHTEYQAQNKWYDDPRPHLLEPSNSAIHFLAKMLEQEIRSAKKTHLSAGEVLLPNGLLQRVSEHILKMAQAECCGLQGMTLHLLYEGEEDCRRMSCLKLDPSTPSTFEVYLTFKQANAGWGFLPQFLKRITRGGTVILSTDYEMTKKKLYRAVHRQ
ncbi:protein charybde-like [Rhynchophorus ferrugineus]|uniref:Protein charybde n=1 Tax=Rhynchophorus ferrugineus TaxID=354439 RepID=A0A834M6M1_RHYFE|nr:hypothetical protein GWI33_019772 [Rhynchophorus ferrugineus]